MRGRWVSWMVGLRGGGREHKDANEENTTYMRKPADR